MVVKNPLALLEKMIMPQKVKESEPARTSPEIPTSQPSEVSSAEPSPLSTAPDDSLFCWSQVVVDNLSTQDRILFGNPSADAVIPPIIQSAIEKSDGEKWARIKPYLSCSKKEPEPSPVVETCENTMVTAQKAITFYETMHERITGSQVSFSLPKTCSEAKEIVDGAMAFGEFSQTQPDNESNDTNGTAEKLKTSNELQRRGLKKQVHIPFVNLRTKV